MLVVTLLLAALIEALPISLVVESSYSNGFVPIFLGGLLAIVGLRMPVGEMVYFLKVAKYFIAALAVPLVFIVIQILPLRTAGMANLWQLAQAALNEPLAGSLTTDIGATTQALVQYLSFVFLTVVSAAVCIERSRADTIFVALALMLTVIGALVLVESTTHVGLLMRFDSNLGLHDSIINCASLGVILTAGAALKRHEEMKVRKVDRWSRGSVVIGALVIASGICAAAVLTAGTVQTYFATSCGLALIWLTKFFRRYGLGGWAQLAVAGTAIVGLIAIVAWQPTARERSLFLAFASAPTSPSTAVTSRMMDAMGWTGSGAGTFEAVFPMYRGADELNVAASPPTTFAALIVEFGLPFGCAVLFFGVLYIAKHFRASLRRQRDWVYSAAGAGCITAAVFLGFTNAGILSPPTTIVIAIIIGLALAQAESRTTSLRATN